MRRLVFCKSFLLFLIKIFRHFLFSETFEVELNFIFKKGKVYHEGTPCQARNVWLYR